MCTQHNILHVGVKGCVKLRIGCVEATVDCWLDSRVCLHAKCAFQQYNYRLFVSTRPQEAREVTSCRAWWEGGRWGWRRYFLPPCLSRRRRLRALKTSKPILCSARCVRPRLQLVCKHYNRPPLEDRWTSLCSFPPTRTGLACLVPTSSFFSVVKNRGSFPFVVMLSRASIHGYHIISYHSMPYISYHEECHERGCTAVHP